MEKPTLKERARDELRSYALIAGYLFICLVVLMFFESTLPGGGEIGSFSLGAAAIKALVLGKFILIGEALGVGTTAVAPRLGSAIFAKSMQFLLLLILLTAIEELLVGKLHGRTFGQTVAEYESRSVLRMLAKCLVALLILLPFIATKELSRKLGPGVLRRLLFERRQD